MDYPLVTIGIPVYNVGHYIGCTLKSILVQTYTNFELIITDDGSTDDTVAVIKSFADSRIQLIVDGENRGISYRLNQQIDLARGTYFIRMDGDDLMFPDRVEKEIEYLQKHPDVDAVGGRAVVIDDKNEILGMRGTRNACFTKADVFASTRFIHPTVAGKITWFRKWKYREELAGCEDMDLWIRSFDHSAFADLDEPILFYRDPLRFKLKTYVHRQVQVLKCMWNLRTEIPHIFILFRCGIKAVASICFSTILCVLGKDKQMIARRNKQISSDAKIRYAAILKKIV